MRFLPALAGLCATGLMAAAVSAPTVASTPGPAAPAQLAAGANTGKPPCNTKPKLKGKKPGQLLAQAELPVDPAVLTGARMFRVLYTTTGVDEKSVEATCGLVLLPTNGLTNQIVAWSHGTVGVHQKCQPSNDPDRFLNFGTIKYGTPPNVIQGTPQNGVWQGLMDQGRIVTATDYYSGIGGNSKSEQVYVLGVPSGAAVLDSVRVGIQLAKQVAGYESGQWKTAIWGASQGGQAALWAGQLARDYLTKTKLSGQPAIDMVGVVAAVPASNFVATKKSPKSLVGRHLADLEMHKAMLKIPPNTELGAAGPILFSLVMTAWDQFPGTGTLSKKAKFPGYPRGITPKKNQVLTVEGLSSSKTVSANCFDEAGALKMATATQGYLADPKNNRFFVNPLWGKPNKQGVWTGQLDKTCLNKKTKQGLRNWCDWLAYNMPGPAGINPFNKYPKRADGSPAPVLIGQGMDDTLIYCQNDSPTVPSPKDCMSRQLYDQLATKQICQATSVTLDLFAKTETSPASHLSTTLQLADNGQAGFKGSPTDKFFNDAFAGTTGTGCAASVLNP